MKQCRTKVDKCGIYANDGIERNQEQEFNMTEKIYTPIGVAGLRMYTPVEVAGLLNVTRRTIYAWLKEGKLGSVKMGTRVRIDPKDLELFIKAHRRTAATCETTDTEGK